MLNTRELPARACLVPYFRALGSLKYAKQVLQLTGVRVNGMEAEQATESRKTVSVSRLPDQKRLWRQFGPLAISGLFFPIARPFINATLSRTEDPAVALAAYSVTLGLTFPIMSALFALRQIATALCVDRDMTRRLSRLTFVLGLVSTLILLGLSIPTIFRILVGNFMGIPTEITRICPPILVILAISTLPSIWRGFHQGILVHYGRTRPIGTAAIFYLIAVIITMILGNALTPIHGAVLAAVATLVGFLVNWLTVRRPSQRVIERRIPNRDPKFDDTNRSVAYILRLYIPLAVSTIFISLTQPAIQAAMARMPEAEISLAAFPVCYTIAWLIRTPLLHAQQLVIAHTADRSAIPGVGRFMFRLGLLHVGLLGITALPPCSLFVFSTLMGLSGPILEAAMLGFPWLISVPFFQTLRGFYSGTLISQGATKDIQLAAIVRVVFLGSTLIIGVLFLTVPGILLAVWAGIISESAECITLRIMLRRKLR